MRAMDRVAQLSRPLSFVSVVAPPSFRDRRTYLVIFAGRFILKGEFHSVPEPLIVVLAVRALTFNVARKRGSPLSPNVPRVFLTSAYPSLKLPREVLL